MIVVMQQHVNALDSGINQEVINEGGQTNGMSEMPNRNEGTISKGEQNTITNVRKVEVK